MILGFVISSREIAKRLRGALRDWMYPDALTGTLRYLHSNRRALSEEDRRFVRIMQQRRAGGLPLDERHERRLAAIAKDIWMGGQW